MTSFQKTIKHLAMGFAILLAFGIISTIATIIFSIFSIPSFFLDNDTETMNFSQEYVNVSSIDIENGFANLNIKVGDTFKVVGEGVKNQFKVDLKNGVLKIRNKSKINHFIHNINKKSEITVFLPQDFIANQAILDTGAGNIRIDHLNANKFFIDAGVGNINIDYINADYAKINAGVGNINISNMIFNSSDIDAGVGEITLSGIITGNNKLDAGVGNLELNLNGNAEDYDFDIDSGIGRININGESYKNYRRNNNSNNLIKVDGGVGNVDINFNSMR